MDYKSYTDILLNSEFDAKYTNLNQLGDSS